MKRTEIRIGSVYRNRSGYIWRRVDASKVSDIGIKDRTTLVYTRVRGNRGSPGGDMTLGAFARWAYEEVERL